MSPTQILHIRAFGTNGLTGLSPISQARESIGLALATEEFEGRFFSNGATLGRVLEHPGRLTDEGVTRLRESFTALHGGLSNSHRLAILEEGMKLTTSGVPPRDAQFLELRQFQVAEIARIFRVPLHLIGDLNRATNNNVEQMALDFVIHTLRPWIVRIEQSLNRSLLADSERSKYFAEFSIDGLLRGDVKSRSEALQIQRQNGIINADEWRAIENRNPLPDGKGQIYIAPLNMAPLGQQQEPTPAKRSVTETRSQEQRAKTRHTIQQSFVPVLDDAVARILRRELQDVRNLLKKHLRDSTTLQAALETFYQDHRDFVGKNIRSAVVALSNAIATELEDELDVSLRNNPKYLSFVEDFITGYAGRFTQSSYRQLKALIEQSLIDGSDINTVLEERLTEWSEKRPAKEAKNESTRIGGAVAHTLFGLAGATRLVWRNVGDSCEICKKINGKTVGIEHPFASPGDILSDLAVKRHVHYPPLHRACTCIISRA
jgi:hypothetical protein